MSERRPSLLILLALCVLATLGLTGSGRPHHQTTTLVVSVVRPHPHLFTVAGTRQPTTSPRLLFIGDSLTLGAFAHDRPASYAERVTTALHGTRLDAGNHYGWTLLYSAQVMTHTPPPPADVVVLELGTNDQPATRAAVAAAYTYVLGLIRRTSPHAALVCLGPWRGHDWDAITAIEQTACRAAGGRFIPLTPLYLDMALHGPMGRLTAYGRGDWFHPNDAGHLAISRLVLAALPSCVAYAACVAS